MLQAAKVIIYSFIFFSISTQSVNGQLEAGFKLGASTINLANPDLGEIILGEDGLDDYKLSVSKINFGYHLGLYSRLKVWKLFLQPEVILNSHSVEYTLEDFNDPSISNIYKEQYTRLDVPVLLGLKFGWFNIHGGISGHLPIANVSELKNVTGYSISAESFTYSYLGGLGFDLGNFRLDFRYELSTTFFGDHITYKGNKYQFEDKNNRIIAGIGYKF